MSSAQTSSRERDAVHEAAHWFARLGAAQENRAVREAWRGWLDSCPENRRAWAKVEAVQRCFAGVPGELALQALQDVDATRRRVLRGALLGLGSIPLGLVSMKAPSAWQASVAQLKTRVGEISTLTLADGTLASLDTDSAADAFFESGQRRLVLHRGRVHISARAGGASAHSPLIVQTRYGEVQATDAEFAVGVEDGEGRVHVARDTVRVVPHPTDGGARVLEAGHCARFSASGVGAPLYRPKSFMASWHTGSLVAVNMRLAKLVSRLRPYRHGALFLDDRLAALKVSGAFPLARSDLALSALENSYPLRVRHLTRYATWIVPLS